MNKTKEDIISEGINSFYHHLSPFGSLDIYRAIKIIIETRTEDDKFYAGSILAEIVEDWEDSTGENFADNKNTGDVVALVYEDILQYTREKIIDLTGYDFINDFTGSGSGIYVYGNYIGTNYDFSDDAIDELKIKIKDIHDELKADIKVDWFLDSIGMTYELYCVEKDCGELQTDDEYCDIHGEKSEAKDKKGK